jgi:Photosynthetic reaction centre cytochrome C subunit
MTRTARRVTSSLAGLVLATSAVFAATSLRTAASPQGTRDADILEIEKQIAGREQQPAEQVFKSIQTFKGQPAIRVLRVMEQAFVANLGVKCTHCHVEGKWDAEDKREKQIARDMWTLRAEVQTQVRKITGKNDAVVTCYTCHKGQAKPAFAPGG